MGKQRATIVTRLRRSGMSHVIMITRQLRDPAKRTRQWVNYEWFALRYMTTYWDEL